MSDTDLSQQTSLDDTHAMIVVAKRRGIVRLRNGQLATLVSWGKPKPGRTAGTTNQVRLETCDGEHRYTSRKDNVVEVVQ